MVITVLYLSKTAIFHESHVLLSSDKGNLGEFTLLYDFTKTNHYLAALNEQNNCFILE